MADLNRARPKRGRAGSAVPAATANATTSSSVSNVGHVSNLGYARVGEIEQVPHRDRFRAELARWLVVLLVAIVGLGFGLTVLGPALHLEVGAIHDLVQLFFTAVLALVSSVVGFYFGAEHKASRDDKEEKEI